MRGRQRVRGKQRSRTVPGHLHKHPGRIQLQLHGKSPILPLGTNQAPVLVDGYPACVCRVGYEVSRCVDIDECLVDNGGCEHACVNKQPGTYTCECARGFRSPDGVRCAYNSTL